MSSWITGNATGSGADTWLPTDGSTNAVTASWHARGGRRRTGGAQADDIDANGALYSEKAIAPERMYLKKRSGFQLMNPGIVMRFPVSTYRNTARTIGELKKMIVRPAVTNANVFETPLLMW
jgi:hypothetical protein